MTTNFPEALALASRLTDEVGDVLTVNVSGYDQKQLAIRIWVTTPEAFTRFTDRQPVLERRRFDLADGPCENAWTLIEGCIVDVSFHEADVKAQVPA